MFCFSKVESYYYSISIYILNIYSIDSYKIYSLKDRSIKHIYHKYLLSLLPPDTVLESSPGSGDIFLPIPDLSTE